MGGQANKRRLLGAAALSLTTMAAASGVLAPTAASATEQAPAMTVAAAPFLKTEAGAFDKVLQSAWLKVADIVLKKG